MGAGIEDCTFAILPVKVRLKNSCVSVNTYAFLDSGSKVSFCSKSLMDKLGATGKKMNITVDTVEEPHHMTTYSIKGLILRDLDEHNSIHLDRVYKKDRIPANDSHIPRTKDIEQWSHLDGVILPVLPLELCLAGYSGT
jgi:hypothetical protein